MKKYIKKRIEVEAEQFICGSEVPVMNFLGLTEECKKGSLFYENNVASIKIHQPEVSTLIIKTLEGNMEAKNGDYIIKGVNGEFYPCKKDIFEKTYEEVNENKIKLNLYTLITTESWTGGMVLVAAENEQEAITLCNEDEFMEYYKFNKPKLVENVVYNGNKGIIRYDAHEG